MKRVGVDVTNALAEGLTIIGRRESTRAIESPALNDQQLWERLGSRIAHLLNSDRVKESHRVGQLPDGKTVWVPYLQRGAKGKEADIESFLNLRDMRRVVERKLGPTRLPGGMPTILHHNGIGYVVHPYQAWMHEYLPTFGCFPQVNGTWLKTRDTIVWYLWHYRKKAVVLTGPLSSKTRILTKECVKCGHRRAAFGRRRKVVQLLRCPKCGEGGFRDITPSVDARPFGRITRIGLRRRFHIREREMKWILSATLAKFPPDAPHT
jgi:ribosomal protein S27E